MKDLQNENIVNEIITIIKSDQLNDQQKIAKLESFQLTSEFLNNIKTEFGCSILHEATLNSGVALVAWLLDICPDLLDKKSGAGTNVLFYAAKYSNIVLCQYFIQRKRELTFVRNNNDATLLHFIAIGKLGIANFRDFFSEIEINLDSFNVPTNNKAWPIHYAAQYGNSKIIMEFIELRKEINIANRIGEFPLHIAAKYGYLTIVQQLLESRKVAINQVTTSKQKSSIVYYAAGYGRIDILQYLVETLHCNIHQPNAYGWFPIDNAAFFLYSNSADDEKKELYPDAKIAAEYHYQTVEYLIKRGAVINQVNAKGSFPLYEAVRSGDKNVVQLLLNSGAETQVFNKDGHSVMHLAADENLKEITEILLEQDRNLLNSQNTLCKITPLHVAARKGSLDVLKYLLQKGAVQIPDKDGFFPIHLATEQNHVKVIEILHQYGESLTRETDNIYKAQPAKLAANKGAIGVIQFLYEKGVDLNVANAQGFYPIHGAVKYNHIPVVNFWFEKFPKMLHPLGPQKQTLIHSAVSVETINLDLLALLIAKGIRVNANDEEGNTALHLVCSKGDKKAIEFLLSKGAADFHATSKNGKLPLYNAINSGNLDAVEVLLDTHAVLYDNQQGKDYFTYALEKGHFNIMQLILKKEEDIKKKFEQINVPFQSFIKREIYGIPTIHVIKEMIVVKVKNKDKDKNKEKDKEKDVDLLKLVENILELLVTKGANINSVDYKNETLLDKVITSCIGPMSLYFNLIDLMLSFGAKYNLANYSITLSEKILSNDKIYEDEFSCKEFFIYLRQRKLPLTAAAITEIFKVYYNNSYIISAANGDESELLSSEKLEDFLKTLLQIFPEYFVKLHAEPIDLSTLNDNIFSVQDSIQKRKFLCLLNYGFQIKYFTLKEFDYSKYESLSCKARLAEESNLSISEEVEKNKRKRKLKGSVGSINFTQKLSAEAIVKLALPEKIKLLNIFFALLIYGSESPYDKDILKENFLNLFHSLNIKELNDEEKAQILYIVSMLEKYQHSNEEIKQFIIKNYNAVSLVSMLFAAPYYFSDEDYVANICELFNREIKDHRANSKNEIIELFKDPNYSLEKLRSILHVTALTFTSGQKLNQLYVNLYQLRHNEIPNLIELATNRALWNEAGIELSPLSIPIEQLRLSGIDKKALKIKFEFFKAPETMVKREILEQEKKEGKTEESMELDAEISGNLKKSNSTDHTNSNKLENTLVLHVSGKEEEGIDEEVAKDAEKEPKRIKKNP